MDKIKLFTSKKDHLPKKIIENEFEYIGSSYDYLKHNNKIKFKNDKVGLTIDKYGLQLITNPTNYLRDNNIEQINRTELKEFKQIFEADLQTNTDKYILTGFDYNINITTDYPVGTYLNAFQRLPRYKKEIYSNGCGITFINQCKSFCIYDKIKQMADCGSSIPADHSKSNIMRLELGIKSRLTKTSNLSTIHTLEDLTITENYLSMIREYENIYNKINKQPLFKFRNMDKPHPSIISTDEFIMISFLNEYGIDNYFQLLEQETMMTIISYKQMKSRKEKALLLWNKYREVNGNTIDLYGEMNAKVLSKLIENRQRSM